jgi:glycosyltransferase involved in cell wall biosynthesis
MADLVEALAVPAYIYIHDYALWCPRLHLTSYNNAYCGEPDDVRVCDACVRDLGTAAGTCPSVSDYRRQNDRLLRKASGCYVSSMDVKLRIGRQFPGIRTTIVPWEGAIPARTRSDTPVLATQPFKVVVMGAIGLEKGYDTLLACARDADRRNLPLSFHVVGFTIDDDRLMETGRVFISGQYQQDEAAELIEQADAHLGFVPSVCPETWCFTLSELLASGLPVVTFDLGTQAERTGTSPNGLVLPPTLPPHAVNDEMLRHIRRRAAHPVRPNQKAIQ